MDLVSFQWIPQYNQSMNRDQDDVETEKMEGSMREPEGVLEPGNGSQPHIEGAKFGEVYQVQKEETNYVRQNILKLLALQLSETFCSVRFRTSSKTQVFKKQERTTIPPYFNIV